LQVLVPINESGCVLTWDFDVARGECEFVLLRSNKVMLPEQVTRLIESFVASVH